MLLLLVLFLSVCERERYLHVCIDMPSFILGYYSLYYTISHLCSNALVILPNAYAALSG
jgi:hypothetical protein